MFIHKILIPQLIVKKEAVLEIVEKCKKMGLDDTSIIKFYTISLTKIKNLTKKTKEKLKIYFKNNMFVTVNGRRIYYKQP